MIQRSNTGGRHDYLPSNKPQKPKYVGGQLTDKYGYLDRRTTNNGVDWTKFDFRIIDWWDFQKRAL